MQNKFCLCVVLAMIAVWYAFAFAGPRQVYVEVSPESVERIVSDISKMSEDARAAGRPLMGNQLRALVKTFDLSKCGPGYDIRVLSDGGERWVVAAVPHAQRVEKTTWVESVLYLRETTEIWPMLTVRCDEPGYRSDADRSATLASSIRDASSIHIERRVEPSPLGETVRLTIRSADELAIEGR